VSRQAITGLVATMLALLSLTSAASATDPIPDPSANSSLSNSTQQTCHSGPLTSPCTNAALSDIDAARASENVIPMTLPGDFSSLTVPEQLLVLSNLERIDRGLEPIEGLSSNLNADAQQGAETDDDPPFTSIYGSQATGNWEGGYTNALESDFVWMYDDGYGSGNLDCTSPSASDCWGHRHDILTDFAEPAVMGAAYDASTADGASETEIFVGDDGQAGSGQPDAPLAPTWSTIAATLPIGLSATTLHPSGTTHSAQLEAWASGEAMNVQAAVTTDPGGWSVSPAGCALAAGKSCTLTVIEQSSNSAIGTLTLTGPNGAQTVSLNGGTVSSTVNASLTHSRIKRGRSAKLTGTVTPSQAGREVELQRRHHGGWQRVASSRLGRHSGFSFTVKGSSKGTTELRVYLPGVANGPAASSRTLKLTVY
jgi:hypothetical protein